MMKLRTGVRAAVVMRVGVANSQSIDPFIGLFMPRCEAERLRVFGHRLLTDDDLCL